jgi:peptidoglycan/xylan/chitin deacetylase (PgdA/CDA1 family)
VVFDTRCVTIRLRRTLPALFEAGVFLTVLTAADGCSPAGAVQKTPLAAPAAAPAARPQPGVKWSEDQLKQAVAPVRAGRKLTPKRWPNSAKVAVCLSFDIDNESPTLAQGITLPVPLSGEQYGATEGLPRILALLDREQVPASFYIPAVSAILAPDMIPAIMKPGRHEIGVHGWIHENLPDLNDADEEERLLRQVVEYVTKATGKRPVGNRAPSWAFSNYTMDILRKVGGFEYDSSLMAMDEPYELMSNGHDTGIMELPVDWIQDDGLYFGPTGTMPSADLVYQTFQEEFDRAYREGTMFMLTMHPHISGHRSRIDQLEKLVAHMKSKPGVWFATGQQIADYITRGGSAPSKTD